MNWFSRIFRGPMPKPKPPALPPVAPPPLAAAPVRLVVDDSLVRKVKPAPKPKAETDWRYTANPTNDGLRGHVATSAPTPAPSSESRFADDVDNLLLKEGLISSECLALDRFGRAAPQVRQQATGVPFLTSKPSEVTPEAYRNRIQYREFCKVLGRDATSEKAALHPFRR
jgi:hypothetical protein